MHISEYVVYETGESRGSLGTDDADASDEGAVHGTIDEAEDMLHAASNLGLPAVTLLLVVCQRMVAMPFEALKPTELIQKVRLPLTNVNF